ncbi:MAG: gamma-glutamyltransferase family protein [Planctomycetaceae bacterium]
MSKQLYGLNASGRSPYALNIGVFRDLGLSEIPDEGPLCWSVPGCVDGWAELRNRFGTKSLADLLAPAIRYATEGFPVSEIIAGNWEGTEQAFMKWPDSTATWLIDGRPPQIGEIFRNPNLAATYRMIAAGGRDAFYRGSIAQRIVAFSDANGGKFSMKDFADHKSDWVSPVSTHYRGYDVWELPPNGQGIAALEMLNILEAYDVAKMGRGSPEYVHLLVEAKKLAFADRATYYADPALSPDQPIDRLISKTYAAQQRKRIDPNKAATGVAPGNPRLEQGDTVYLSVVDKDRNCCSFIQSNFANFGSQVTPGNLGFVLQNRGASFALDEAHVNSLQPHKRPFHTIIPAMATREGRPWLCFGVMGGDMQPQGHVQILVNMIDFGMNVQEAGDAARVRHLGSQTPTGHPMDPDGGKVAVESGISEATIKALQERGHQIVRSPGSFGGYQGILIDHEHGVLQGGTDPRKDGCAAGY